MRPDYENALQAQINNLEERQGKLRAEIERLQAHLGGLRQALSLYRGEPEPTRKPTGQPSSASRGSRVPDPRKSAVWAFALSRMESAPPDGIDIDDLNTAIVGAGYEMSRNTLRSNLSNAAREGVIERVGYGRYRRPPPSDGYGELDGASAPDVDDSDDDREELSENALTFTR